MNIIKLTVPTTDQIKKELKNIIVHDVPVNKHIFSRREERNGNIVNIYEQQAPTFNPNNGWITPYGKFIECEYAEHESIAEVLCTYFEEIIKENSFCDFKPYDEINKILTCADYLVSQSWIRWRSNNDGNLAVVKKGEVNKPQLSTISYLSNFTNCREYKFDIVDFSFLLKINN